MTSYSMLHGSVSQEITGVEIDGKSYSIGQVRQALAQAEALRETLTKVANWQFSNLEDAADAAKGALASAEVEG